MTHLEVLNNRIGVINQMAWPIVGDFLSDHNQEVLKPTNKIDRIKHTNLENVQLTT